MKGRNYDPNTHTFLTPDPVLDTTTSQTLNPYTYVHNDPLNNTDPTGLTARDINCPGGDRWGCHDWNQGQQANFNEFGQAGEAYQTGGSAGLGEHERGALNREAAEHADKNATDLADAAEKAAIEAADRAAAQAAKSDKNGSTQAGSGDILDNTTAAAGLCSGECATEPWLRRCHISQADYGEERARLLPLTEYAG